MIWTLAKQLGPTPPGGLVLSQVASFSPAQVVSTPLSRVAEKGKIKDVSRRQDKPLNALMAAAEKISGTVLCRFAFSFMLMNGADYYTRLLIGMWEDMGKIADEAKTKTPASIHRAHADECANRDNNL